MKAFIVACRSPPRHRVHRRLRPRRMQDPSTRRLPPALCGSGVIFYGHSGARRRCESEIDYPSAMTCGIPGLR